VPQDAAANWTKVPAPGAENSLLRGCTPVPNNKGQELGLHIHPAMRDWDSGFLLARQAF